MTRPLRPEASAVTAADAPSAAPTYQLDVERRDGGGGRGGTRAQRRGGGGLGDDGDPGLGTCRPWR
jgi:hypothetical protein